MSKSNNERIPLARAQQLAERIAAELTPYCDRIEVAGSIRRRRPTCGDLDLVCVPRQSGREKIVERCVRTSSLIKDGDQYAVIRLANGIQLDLWFANGDAGADLFAPPLSNFGVLLLARTGSAAHNIWIAQRAQSLGLHFNPQRGLFRGPELVAAAEEADIFSALGLAFIPPEERER